MLITAQGYARKVVNQHKITERVITAEEIVPSGDGATIMINRSKKLALSGYFSMRVTFTGAEIRDLAQAATVERLERRIAILEKQLALMPHTGAKT